MTEEHCAVEIAFLVVVKCKMLSNQVQHVKLIQIQSHNLVYCSHGQFG